MAQQYISSWVTPKHYDSSCNNDKVNKSIELASLQLRGLIDDGLVKKWSTPWASGT